MRAWTGRVPFTQGARVSAADGRSKLINSLVSVDVQDAPAHTWTRLGGADRCGQSCGSGRRREARVELLSLVKTAK